MIKKVVVAGWALSENAKRERRGEGKSVVLATTWTEPSLFIHFW